MNMPRAHAVPLSADSSIQRNIGTPWHVNQVNSLCQKKCRGTPLHVASHMQKTLCTTVVTPVLCPTTTLASAESMEKDAVCAH